MLEKLERRSFLRAVASVPVTAAMVTERIQSVFGKVENPQRFLVGYAPGSLKRTTEHFWQICDKLSEAGFHYVEVDNTDLRIAETYLNRTKEFNDEMEKRNLRLLGLNQAYPLEDPEKEEEIKKQNITIATFLEKVGGTYTGPYGALSENEREARRIARLANVEGRRILEENGIKFVYHTHSSVGFGRLMDLTNPDFVYLNPDLGWLAARGSLNALDVVKSYRSRIYTIHFKDFAPTKRGKDYQGNEVQGIMVPLGEGSVEFQPVVDFLKESNFTGCVMGELVGLGQYEFVRSPQAHTVYPKMANYMREDLGLRL